MKNIGESKKLQKLCRKNKDKIYGISKVFQPQLKSILNKYNNSKEILLMYLQKLDNLLNKKDLMLI